MKRISLLIILLLCALSAFGQAVHSNNFTWTFTQAAGTDTPTGFHVWRVAASGNACPSMGSTPYATITGVSTLSYTDTGVVAGNVFCYEVTAYGTAGTITTDSSPSNEVTCVSPFLLSTPGNLQGSSK